VSAKKLREVLNVQQSSDEENLSSEDILIASLQARGLKKNLSYYAFTATPKAKTLEMFGTLSNPNEPASATNKPKAFHEYTMRQAIEEGFILDVLKV